MSQPYVGQILLVPYNFAPAGWMLCQGQVLPISEFSTLFQLIGTTYGGNGQTTFNLPDLRGRIPLHQGSNGVSTYVVGQLGGLETVTVTVNQIPAHTHAAQASDGTVGTAQDSPAGAYWNKWPGAAYSTAGTNATLNAAAVSTVGGSQPHDNMPPFLVMNYIISLFGVFPSQN
jgi:microcystin-dependent protein